MTPGRRDEFRRYIQAETDAAIRHARLKTPESWAFYLKMRRRTRSFIDTIKETT